ncbi:hypothetical protein FBF83_08225 [Pseudalkalibacillus hwajinpoensis]|uniref:Uncharacterized protein n=1 Tax=Guptibacillus hwajinpoensis TaxID=208199 RepID=A0A4U1MJ55_9BACL|nr:hypothetical protein FBF83_08225 [Pseudalkalibacillus hwajinpoensis]
MEQKVLDSCGMSGTGETPQARPSVPRRLTARPAESEHLERKSTTTLIAISAIILTQKIHKQRSPL